MLASPGFIQTRRAPLDSCWSTSQPSVRVMAYWPASVTHSAMSYASPTCCPLNSARPLGST
eukprot:13924839-Heterocapsa_arctica.AAC.1